MKLIFRAFPVAVLAGLLGFAGCESGTSPQSTGTSGPTRIGGHVLNDDGPINEAQIEAKDSQGHVAARTELKGGNRYSLILPAGTNFPIVIEARPDNAAEPALKAAVTSALATEQDISPVSTIVVDTALSLGGLTEPNLTKAAGAAIAQRKKSGGGGGGSGTTSQSFKGDPTKQYGGWH